jgi:adenylate kinase
MKKNKLVILIGPPGSGKGSQALLLADKKRMHHLEVSKLLEKRFLYAKPEDVIKIGEEEYKLKEQERRWREGLLCEDAFVAKVVEENIEKLKEETEPILLDGYPRTKSQALLAFPSLLSLYGKEGIFVIYLDIGEEESLKRNAGRRVCSLMRHSIINIEETKNLTVCPVDGSSLEKRVMDDPEKIKTRLKKFREETIPAIKYIEEEGIKIIKIDGMGSISDVFFRVLKEVEDFGL